jgi:hypothetical protein
VAILMTCIFLIIVGVASYKIGFHRGKNLFLLNDDSIIQRMHSIQGKVGNTGIAKFGRKHPDQTEHEKGYLHCVDTLNAVIEEETKEILKNK